MALTSFAPAARAGDWTTYLGDNARSGYAAGEVGITAGNASTITTQSLVKYPDAVTDEPMVVGGNVYLGTWDGLARATAANGSSIWTRNLGQTTPSCASATGIAGSAAVAGIPATTIFMPGGDGQFYALNAADGTVVWHTRLGPTPDTFVWGSPAYYNGHIFIGLSSSDDCPLVRAGLYELDAATGAIQHLFYTVPSGCLGASIWTTPTVDPVDGTIYITTGNHDACGTTEPYAEAIVKLNASDLSYIDSWKVPTAQLVSDSDFGAGATLFTATIGGVQRSLVGASNKDGWFYALDRNNLSAGPVWEYQLGPGGASPDQGAGPIAPAAWDGSRLYIGGTNGTIAGTSCNGTLRAFDPATGVPAWQRCFADGVVIAAPVAVPGVVTAAAGPAIYVVDAATGATLYHYTESGGTKFEGPGAVSNGSFFYGNTDGRLVKLTPASPPPPPSAPVNTSLPVISGTPQVGQALSVSNGTWTGSPPPTFGYAWQSCDADGSSNCLPVTGGASATYTPVTGDVGRRLIALVTASNSAGQATATSAPTQAVASPPPPTQPQNTGLPTITGIAQVGQTLTTTAGTWTGSPTPTFGYSWEDCDADGTSNCAPITGATVSTYTPATTDVGRSIVAVVTATNTAGQASARSAPVGPITAQVTQNLLTNGSFEGSLAGWTGWQSVLGLASDGASGPGAALVTVASSVTSYSIYPSTRPVRPTSANVTYSATGQTRAATSGGTVCLYIREWFSTGTVVSTSSKCVTESTAWQAFPAVTYTTSQSGGSLEVFAYQSGARAGASFEVDALSLTTGSSPPPPPPPTDPDTAITSGPSGTTTSTTATFTFTSTIAGSSFQCALDGPTWTGCASPATYNALSLGNHTFQVRAITTGGLIDPTPDSRNWTITTSSSNLITNGSFEGSTSGWFGYNATIGLANDGFVGAGAGKVSLQSGHTSFSIYPSPRPVRPTTAATTYTAGGYLRAATAGAKVCLFIREWSSTGAIVAVNSGCATATTAWQPFPVVTYTTKQTGGSLEVYAYEGQAVAGASYEVDGLSLNTG